MACGQIRENIRKPLNFNGSCCDATKLCTCSTNGLWQDRIRDCAGHAKGKALGTFCKPVIRHLARGSAFWTSFYPEKLWITL